jgi:quinol monooxygenase YgiN
MIILAGSFRLRADAVSSARPHLERMVAESRAEDGCLAYTYAFDLGEPSLVGVFEMWRDRAAHQAHNASPHLAAWQKLRPGFGYSDRQLTLWETGPGEPA